MTYTLHSGTETQRAYGNSIT